MTIQSKTFAINSSNDLFLRMNGKQPEDISLDWEWDFTYTPADIKDIPDMPPDSAFDVKIRVPVRWDEQLDLFHAAAWWPKAEFLDAGWNVRYLSGVGWHRTTIDVPTAWQNKTVSLTVGWAAGGRYHVWLNRSLVGRYDCGSYTPFSFDLTPHLKAGAVNELTIALDNTQGLLGKLTYAGVQGRAGGLFRPVTLHISEGYGRIADVYVRAGADLKEVVWSANLDVPGSGENMVESKIFWEARNIADDRVIAQGEVAVPEFKRVYKANWKQRIPEIKPWSDREPNLYRTKIRWVAGKDVLDRREERFGLRRWSSENRKLFLNGQPIYLRGNNAIQMFYPLTATVSTSREFWLDFMKRLKEFGFNYHNLDCFIPPPELLEAADELGVIVQVGDAKSAFDQNCRPHYKDIWKPIVTWTRNHPSMCVYTFGAENAYYEGMFEQLQKQYALVKSLCPESLVMPMQAVKGVEYAFEEKDKTSLTMAPFPHHAERLVEYTKASDIFGAVAITAAFGYNFFDTPWRVEERNRTVYRRPVVTHEIYMRASYLNPDNAKKYVGRLSPFVYNRLRNQLTAAGLSDKWRTYWENSGKLNAMARKYCVEKTRKCDNLAGYEFLAFTDAQPENYPSGMLDEFLQLKPGDTKEGILRYSNESVLLLDFEDGDGGLNRSYWAKDVLPAEIMLSLYGLASITHGKLSWVLKEVESGKEVWKGECEVRDIRNGYVSAIKSLKIEFPEVKKTTKLNFSVNLDGSEYHLANDWNFWVFARNETPEVVAAADKESKAKLEKRYPKIFLLTSESKEKLHVVSEITQKDVDYLAQGGDVLLLGTRPFPVHFSIYDVIFPDGSAIYPAMAGRHGLSVGAVINTKHPILEDIPDEGWGDWLYMPLLARARHVFFDKTECSTLDIRPFKPVIEMISESSRAEKLATVFEAQVGKGRLLASTCPYDGRNPSQVALMDGLLKYASSEKFKPEMTLAPEILTELVQKANEEHMSVPSVASNAVVRSNGVKCSRWYNKPTTIELDRYMLCKINDGEWELRESIVVGKPGVNIVVTKYNNPVQPDMHPRTKLVGIDPNPPTIILVTTPILGQDASMYYAAPDTVFSIEARDDLSGVKMIEVSIDGADYKPYAGSFRLKEGIHSVRCRAADLAGNQQETITGEAISVPDQNIVVHVMRAKVAATK